MALWIAGLDAASLLVGDPVSTWAVLSWNGIDAKLSLGHGNTPLKVSPRLANRFSIAGRDGWFRRRVPDITCIWLSTNTSPMLSNLPRILGHLTPLFTTPTSRFPASIFTSFWLYINGLNPSEVRCGDSVWIMEMSCRHQPYLGAPAFYNTGDGLNTWSV